MQFMVVDGKKYILKKVKHKRGDDTMELIPYNEKEYNKIVEEIAERLEEVVDKKRVIKQAMASLEYEQILSFHKNLVKKKIKPKVKKGCIEIKIGKDSFVLVD